jgi:hypothetical protein
MPQIRKLDVGKNSVVIGNVRGSVGDNSVVIGATDSRGNTIINTPMIVGSGAQGGPTDIVIGADAGCRPQGDFSQLLIELGKAVELTNDKNLVSTYNDMVAECEGDNGSPDKEKLLSFLGCFQAAASLGGVTGLITQLIQYVG